MGWSEEEVVKIRRDLHQIPEIGLSEFQTHAYLMSKIKELPKNRIEVKTMETAITVRVKGTNPTKTIGWRTDIDGLPIKEETGLSYSSQTEGRMHACGHDFHMTIALGVLERVAESQLENDVLFFFQPAEENLSGAKIYYDNGFVGDESIDEMFGLHVAPHLVPKAIGTLDGTLFAGACRFIVTLKGKEGHAAFPHEANDMIVAASSFVQQVQTIISRNVDPMESSVITFGEFNAGIADNVVAGQAVLTGTIRSLTYEISTLTQSRMRDIAEGIARSFNCEVVLELDQKGYVPVVNNSKITQDFMDYFKEKQSVEFVEVKEAMTGEDFGYLLKQIPGLMFWLGVGSEYGLHHGKFNPDESVIFPAIKEISDYIKHRDCIR
ncbi:N-acetyldiaminopimelate deacetylase [Vagococcus hydrophili]|uniref:N-acetyldiaminopimelate deacetylase n=1 Tax=Vagococcus hydrophili TaxID=2714947 RepID=A0A6G8AWX1_9ENTE|nr:N-acetyldiaminopimelate deacetylase [Vagococcus hydrophili]QIL49459.1 N-acetyldiaminopimelate deacetylase [Vagococcus hydrophili]